MSYEPDFLIFASEAAVMALWGAAFVTVALIALAMDRRRLRRKEINRVGWVPWTPLFIVCAVLGGGLLALSVPTLF